MRKIDAQMHRLMPRIDAGRIGPMGGLLMMHLEAIEPCAMQALAEALGRDNSQLTRLVRDLEEKGVLARTPSRQDRRVTMLSLTDEGHAFLGRAKKVLSEVVEEVAAPLTEDERAALLSALKKL
ncbi:MAG: MarR family transcriptional regulator [Pseudomonadota bacterium]